MSKPMELKKSLFMLGVAPNMTAYASAKEGRESLKNSRLFSTGTAIHCCRARWNEAAPSFVAVRRNSQ
jgi:hypothetical protein